MAVATGADEYNLYSLPEWQTYFDRTEENLESHQLLWADLKFDDIGIDGEELLSTLTQFRQLVNHTKAFDHWRTCLNYIEKKDTDTMTFLVCSAAYSKDIVRTLWSSKNIIVWQVYVYCSEESQNRLEWLQNYPDQKICSVYSSLDSLLVTIKDDVQEYLRRKKSGIFSELRWTSEKGIDEYHSSWWRNFIKVLVSLPYPENYHHQLIHEIRKHGFEDNIFTEFQNDFPSTNRAIWWYSRSSYFYGILNKAFRQRNIRVLLLFGSFLQDLYQQLKSEHLERKQWYEDYTITVYRGQVLSSEDIEKLAVGFSVRCNSLFSSSTNQNMAVDFLRTSSPNADVERVLFEIEIDYETVCAPFADISQLSYYGNEDETLFMPHTRFLLQSREKKEINIGDQSPVPYWLLKLKLIPDYDVHSARELETMDSHRKTLKNCADALSEMMEMVSAEDVQLVFDTLTRLYPIEKKWISAVKSYSLAMHEFENNDDHYEMVLYYHEEAKAIWQNDYLDDAELNAYFNIAETHFALGELFGYNVENQRDLAIHHWKQALDFYEQALPQCTMATTDYARVSILNKLVRVCRNLLRSEPEEYGTKAIMYQEIWKELIKLQKPIGATSRQIASQYEILGDIYADLYQYDDALSNYEKAVELYLSNENDGVEQWTSYYKLIGLCKRIVTICTEYTNNFSLALKYQLLHHEHNLKEMEDPTDDVTFSYSRPKRLAESHFAVADCYINAKQYAAAYEHLTEGLVYMQKSRELLLQDGRTLVWCGHQPSLVPLTADDDQVKDCESTIVEKEGKLKSLEPLVEQT